MPVRHAKARWEGDIRGKGSFDAGPGIAGEYNLSSRFENGAGSNPESLLGAAHASCFSMALSLGLARAGTPVESVETDAAVTIEKLDAGYTVTKVVLTVRGKVPGIDQEAFVKAAEGAKAGCPISRALNPSVTIELDARLV
ncbi:MAG: OsmC family protein [Pseudomonadota bacterium]|nr:OsmC family protein [Pseudomonadota bacterium]